MLNFKQFFLNEAEGDDIKSDDNDIKSDDISNEDDSELDTLNTSMDDINNKMSQIDNNMMLSAPETKVLWKRTIESEQFSIIVKSESIKQNDEYKMQMSIDLYDGFGKLLENIPVYDVECDSIEDAKSKSRELERNLKIS